MRVAALALVHDRAHAVAGDRARDEHHVAAVAEPRDALAAERERLDPQLELVAALRARRAAPRALGGRLDAHARRHARQQLQQRLLRVAAVLGLIPDALARAVQHLGGDLLAGVRGQVVHRERARRGGVEQRVVDAVVGQRGAPLGAVASSPMLTHTSV